MKKLRISRFDSERDNHPTGEDLEWSELGDLLGASGIAASPCTLETCAVGDNLHRWVDRHGKEHAKGCRHKYVPAWSPAVYPPGAEPCNKNVGTVSLLVVDLDHLTDAALEAAYARVEGYSHVAHPSHGDRPADRCWRVVVALSEPVLAEDWPRFWVTAISDLSLAKICVSDTEERVLADPSCCDPSRLYFLPTRRSDASDGQVVVRDGPSLDVRAILAKAPPRAPTRELSDAGDLPPAGPKLLERCRQRLRDHGPAIEGQGGDRWTFSACAALVHGYALTEAEAWPLLLEWNATCVPPWDEDQLREKLENASAYASGPRGGERLAWEAATATRTRLLATADARRAEAAACAESVDYPEVDWDVDGVDTDDEVAAEPRGPLAFDHAAGLRALEAAMRGETIAPGSFAESYRQALAEVRVMLGAPTDDDTHERELAPLFEHAHSVMSRKYDAPTWLVRSLVRRGGTLVVGGEPKTGKSWILTEIALACASGTRAFGEFDTGAPIRVAYFFAEDLAPDVGAHLRALVAGRGAQHEIVKGTALYVQPRGKFVDVLKDEDCAWLIASCRWHGGVDLLCIEPLRDIHSAEEDKSDGMIAVMRRLRMLGELLGATVAAAHHLTKSADGKRGGGKSLRGSGAIHGSLDSGIYLAHRESTETSLMNAVDSEIKGARSAGKFDLALVLEDDAEGRSCRATWHVKRDGSSKIAGQVAGDLADARVDKVIGAISLLEARKSKTTTAPVQRESKLGAAPFQDALEAAMQARLVERVGPRRGYKLTLEGQCRARQLESSPPF